VSGRVDLHCHLLPGIDDGPDSLEKSLTMARVAAEDGTSTVLATTHWPLDPRALEPTPERLHKVAAELRSALLAEGISLEIQPCHELMADTTLAAHLVSGAAFSFGGARRYCLVEMPYHHLPTSFRDIIFQVQARGFTPILAHPERSAPIQQQPEKLDELAEAGCLVQVTASSIVDGGPPARLTRRFLESGVAQIVASDGHSPRRRPPILSEAADELARSYGPAFADAVTRTIPAALLAGAELPPLPPITRRPSLLGRLLRR
jgi:protein-tyrosine phosphatase